MDGGETCQPQTNQVKTMGQTNKQFHTGINRGEYSEFVFALHIIADNLGWTTTEVFEAMAIKDNKVHLTNPRITFYGDGKMVLAYKEYGYIEDAGATDAAKAVEHDAARTAKKLNLPTFNEVRCCGGSSGKDDVTFLLDGTRVAGISLKVGHEFGERRQSPHWANVKDTYESFGVKLDTFEPTYLEAAEEFLKPALRYSKAKGDYSPELRDRADLMLDTFDQLIKYVTNQMVTGNVDTKQLAKRILDVTLGTNDDIWFVELENTKVNFVTRDMVETLAAKLETAKLTVETHRSNTGRSATYRVLADGEHLLSFITTGSTNGTKKQPNMRVVKPQTYVGVNYYG